MAFSVLSDGLLLSKDAALQTAPMVATCTRLRALSGSALVSVVRKDSESNTA